MNNSQTASLVLRVFKLCISCLHVVCSRLVFEEVASPNTRTSEAYCCKLTERVWRKQKSDTSLTGCDQRKGKLNIFSTV